MKRSSAPAAKRKKHRVGGRLKKGDRNAIRPLQTRRQNGLANASAALPAGGKIQLPLFLSVALTFFMIACFEMNAIAQILL